MIPVNVVLVSPSDESLDCGWGSLQSWEAAVRSCLKSSNHSPNLPPAQGLQPARATGAGNAEPPKQHNGGFSETKRLLGNPSTVLSLNSSMNKNPMAQFPESTNISSEALCRKGADFSRIFEKVVCDEKLLFQIKQIQLEDEHPNSP